VPPDPEEQRYEEARGRSHPLDFPVVVVDFYFVFVGDFHGLDGNDGSGADGT
jgi:hypothetical protein